MKKTGRVYKRMIITYILVLCIPVFLSAALYQYTYNTVREQSKKNNNNLLETVKNSCDREISYYKSVLQQLRTDEDVDLLVNGVTLSQGERVYLAREVQMKMTAMVVSMLDYAEYCQDMFIYFSDQDDVVSVKTKANFEYYSTVTMEIDQQESAALREQLDRLENRKMVMVDSKHMEYVLLVEPVRTQTGKPLNIVFGIWVDARVFEQQVKSTDWNYGTELAFVSGDEEIVYVTEGIDRIDLNAEELYGIDDREVNIGGDEYHVHTIESGTYDGKYILFSSASLISQTANKIRNVHLLCMFISVLLGYVVTRVSVRKNYSSLERVINILPERGDGKAGQDEFQYLENRVSDLLERYDDIHENMK